MTATKCVQERGGWAAVALRAEERPVAIRGSLGMRSPGSWSEHLLLPHGAGQWVKLSSHPGSRGDRVRDGRVWSSPTLSGQPQCTSPIEYSHSPGAGFQRRNSPWEEGRMRHPRSPYTRERSTLRKRCANRTNKQENPQEGD